MDRIIVTYHITIRNGEPIEKVARSIALEQTVEVPEESIGSNKIKAEIVGRTEEIIPAGKDSQLYKVKISFSPDLSTFKIPQFLNLIYGNISIQNNIRIAGIDLPISFLKRFKGPSFGIHGIRKILGVYQRPLAATALKPQGADVDHFVKMAETFALGGGDIIKDDHNIGDLSIETFQQRVDAVQAALSNANRQTDRKTLYFPNIAAPIHEIEDYIRVALNSGIQGVLLSPFLLGLDTVRMLSDKYPLIILGHPAFSGTHFDNPVHGIAPAILLGKLFRLIGCDASVYPNFGGRFHFSKEDCLDINDELRNPLGEIKASFPAPAGGMNLGRVCEMADLYGADTIFLIGGALLKNSPDLFSATSEFLSKIRSLFKENLIAPQDTPSSSCECNGPLRKKQILHHLIFQKGFSWQGRDPEAYKINENADFKNILRHELIGKYGESTKFDLRYFQIEKGGSSSMEKHVHEHVIICIRGKGILVKGDEQIILRPFDIAYIGPLEVHQFRNEEEDPFGFFCIVDHRRDHPFRVTNGIA